MSKLISQEEERLTFERLAKENRLGLLKETHTAKAGAIAWTIYTFAVFVFVLFGIWEAIFSEGDALWLRIVSIVFLVLFEWAVFYFGYSAYRTRFDKTLLYEYGLIDKTPEGFQVVRWEQIYYIKKEGIYTQHGSNETYELHLRNGKTLKYGDGDLVAHIERLMKQALEEKE